MLALVPVIVLTALLTTYNLNQARSIGEQAVASFSEDMEASKRQELRNYLELAKTSIQHLYEQPGSANDPEVQQQAWDILRQLRFDDSGSEGYLFAYTTEGVSVMHGVNSALEGRNLWGFQDPNGTYLIRELIEAARNGGGYVPYRWKHPETGNVDPKLGYAEMLPKWGVMIGTGFWIDGLESQVASMEQRLEVSGRDELSQLATAFNSFADQVHGLVRQVRQWAETLNDTTGELNEVMVEAEQGVERQKSECPRNRGNLRADCPGYPSRRRSDPAPQGTGR